jgi:hypothetical protein
VPAVPVPFQLEDTRTRDPRAFKYFPPQWMHSIVPAGTRNMVDDGYARDAVATRAAAPEPPRTFDPRRDVVGNLLHTFD